jgi:hypothetical protein
MWLAFYLFFKSLTFLYFDFFIKFGACGTVMVGVPQFEKPDYIILWFNGLINIYLVFTSLSGILPYRFKYATR